MIETIVQTDLTRLIDAAIPLRRQLQATEQLGPRLALKSLCDSLQTLSNAVHIIAVGTEPEDVRLFEYETALEAFLTATDRFYGQREDVDRVLDFARERRDHAAGLLDAGTYQALAAGRGLPLPA